MLLRAHDRVDELAALFDCVKLSLGARPPRLELFPVLGKGLEGVASSLQSGDELAPLGADLVEMFLNTFLVRGVRLPEYLLAALVQKVQFVLLVLEMQNSRRDL